MLAMTMAHEIPIIIRQAVRDVSSRGLFLLVSMVCESLGVGRKRKRNEVTLRAGTRSALPLARLVGTNPDQGADVLHPPKAGTAPELHRFRKAARLHPGPPT
jgi:hypothetical protein